MEVNYFVQQGAMLRLVSTENHELELKILPTKKVEARLLLQSTCVEAAPSCITVT
jgi:hypothetical protein